MNNRLPLLFQFFETTAWVVAKTILRAKSELCGAEPCRLFVKPGLVELLEPLEYLFKRFGGIDKDRPLTVADNELVHGLAPMNLSLASPQASEEAFEIVVGSPTFGPGITGKESWPTLLECRADARHHFGIFRARLSLLFQFSQKVFDLPLDRTARGAWLTGLLRGIQSAIQFDQPIALTLETAVLKGEWAAMLDDDQELIQNRMAPFLRLRWRVASKRVRSSNTRSPPRTKGGLLPSVSVVRIRSA